MAKTSYLIYIVRATSKGDRSEQLQLDTLGGAGDLLHGFHGNSRRLELAKGLHLNARYEQAFDMLEVEASGRTVWLRADAGAYGVDGNQTNVDTRTRTRRGKRDASMTEKRAMFVVPQGSKEGFLLLERRASAHLKNHLEDTVFRACNSLFGISVDVSAFVDLDAWNNFLDNGEGVEVKSVWRPTTLEGTFTGAALEDEGELQTVVTGAVASRVFRRVKADIVRALLGEDTTADAVEVATPSELIPRDIDNYERSKLALTAILDNEKRTVLVERGAPPQFYYPLGGRPETPVLRDLWVAETEKVARIYGASLPEGWDKGAWTRQQLQVGLRRPS